MSNTKTPKQILSSLLTYAAEAAEQWATNLSLDTFPDTTWDDPAVQHHPALVGWRKIGRSTKPIATGGRFLPT